MRGRWVRSRIPGDDTLCADGTVENRSGGLAKSDDDRSVEPKWDGDFGAFGTDAIDGSGGICVTDQ